MLSGDWCFGLIATIVVGWFAWGFYREHQRGITGVRADISPRRKMVGMGCALAAALAFGAWGVLWVLSDEVVVGSSGFLAGVPIHERTMGLFALAIGAACVYLASRLYEQLGRGDATPLPRGEEVEEPPEPARPRPSVASAQKAWRMHLKGPDAAGLARAVRLTIEAGWGLSANSSIVELGAALEGAGASRAAELATSLLEDLDAARYGGADFEPEGRFEELVELARDAR